MESASRTQAAAIIPLQDILPEFKGSKVRVAGCLAAYDSDVAIGVLTRETVYIPVDLSLCVHNISYLHKPLVMIIGDLETCESYSEELDASHLGDDFDLFAPRLVLRASLVRPCPGLDFQQWDRAARKESQARLLGTSSPASPDALDSAATSSQSERYAAATEPSKRLKRGLP